MRATLLHHIRYAEDTSSEVHHVTNGVYYVGYGSYSLSKKYTVRPQKGVLDVEIGALYYISDNERPGLPAATFVPFFHGRRIRVVLNFGQVMIYWIHGSHTLNYNSYIVKHGSDIGVDNSHYDAVITDASDTNGGAIVTAITPQIVMTILLVLDDTK